MAFELLLVCIILILVILGCRDIIRYLTKSDRNKDTLIVERLLSVIGSSGTVYGGKLVIHEHGSKIVKSVAIKKMCKEDGLEKCQKEIEVLKRISHPNIIRYYSTDNVFLHESCSQEGITKDNSFVMEKLDQNLYQYLDKQNDKPLDIDTQLYICSEIASGLKALHELKPEAILHRDLWPPNILLSENGKEVKICDFGQSKFKQNKESYYTKTTPGKSSYMPSEALCSKTITGKSSPYYSTKSDVFSFGLVMLKIVTLKSPEPDKVIYGVGMCADLVRHSEALKVLPCEHPLKPLIIRCLNSVPDLRPTVNQICTFLAQASHDRRAGNPRFQTILSSQIFNSHYLIQNSKIDWTTASLSPLPIGTINATALLLSDRVYLCGGDCQNEEDKFKVQAYSCQSDSWDVLPKAPQFHCQAAIIGETLTLIGGMIAENGITTVTNILSSWINEEWTRRFPSMNTKRYRPGVITHDKFVIVSGGKKEDRTLLDDLEYLDFTSKVQDTWQWVGLEGLKLPKPLYFHKFAVCLNQVYMYDYWTKKVWKISLDTFYNGQKKGDHFSWEGVNEAPHDRSSLVPFSSFPVLLGGYRSYYYNQIRVPMSPCYVLDPPEQKWKKIEIDESSLQPCWNTTTLSASDESVFILGGQSDHENGPYLKTCTKLFLKLNL